MTREQMAGLFAKAGRTVLLSLLTTGWAGRMAVSSQAQTIGSSGGSTTSNSTVQDSSTVQTVNATANPLANQSMLYPGEDFRLGVGDLISVGVFLQGEYHATVRVGQDGSVELPYIGNIHVEGLSVRAAQNLIADRLRAGMFYAEPEVTIQVIDTVNSTVLITGEVHATVPVSSARSLREVLLVAGGLPASASHTLKIVRPGIADPIVVELGTDVASSTAANIPVLPHDIIQISRASVVYVLGSFPRQGAVPLDQATPLTMLQLAALSGGVNFEGKYADLRLIRTVGNERKVVKVDIKKIRDGRAPDPLLQANDILFLPTDDMKAVIKSLGTGGVIGLATLLLTIHYF
jgi:polysaccharide export outer membrane protein